MALIYEVKKQVLNFKEEKPVVYKVAAVRQQLINFEMLLKEVTNSCGVHRTQTKAVVEALIDRLIHYMNLGMPVRLEEFGTFKPVIKAKTKKNADEVSVDNVVSRNIRFYPCKRMKDMLKELSIQTFDQYEENEDTENDENTDNGEDTETENNNGSGESNPL